jgi:hypothetical protein
MLADFLFRLVDSILERRGLGSVLPGLANLPINRIGELTPILGRLAPSRLSKFLGDARPCG